MADSPMYIHIYMYVQVKPDFPPIACILYSTSNHSRTGNNSNNSEGMWLEVGVRRWQGSERQVKIDFNQGFPPLASE
jgi:hypothetical protein